MFRRLVLSLVLSFAAVLPSQAQLFRAYVSITGNDSNPCTLPAPCRLLPAALNAVGNGGEIWMLDSANYNTGPVLVNKSVTVLAVPGAVGSVVAAGGNAIDISGSVTVTLRNLVIVNLNGTGSNGIAHTGGGELNLVDCDISGLTAGTAVSLVPGASSLKVVVRRAVLRGNGTGILALGDIQLTVDNSQITGHTSRGLLLASRSRTVVSNSVISGNATGIHAQAYGAGAGVTTILEVERSVISNNDKGIETWSTSAGDTLNLVVRGSTISGSTIAAITVDETPGATLTAIVDGNVIVNNQVAFDWGSTTGAQVLTRQNNTVRMNATEITGGGAYTPLAGT